LVHRLPHPLVTERIGLARGQLLAQVESEEDRPQLGREQQLDTRLTIEPLRSL